jgi:hypothetical protein
MSSATRSTARSTITRVRKARRASTLSCGHYVNVGHQIISHDGKRWICVECAIARRRAERSTRAAP